MTLLQKILTLVFRLLSNGLSISVANGHFLWKCSVMCELSLPENSQNKVKPSINGPGSLNLPEPASVQEGKIGKIST